MAKTHPGCRDCREITRSQRRCITCNGKTERAVVDLHDAPGGTGNSGPGVFSGWRCKRCRLLWDGGAAYDFACLAHGGRSAVAPEGARDIDTVDPRPD